MARNKRPRIPKPPIKKYGEIDPENVFAEGVIDAPPRGVNIRTMRTKRPRAPVKRTKTKERRERTIELDIDITTAQSIRGSYEEGTERYQDSEIIHFAIYDPLSQQLAVQLTAAGKWKWYTYQSVSVREAHAFENAPSKGRHFNKYIKKHRFLRGKHLS